MKAAQLTPYDQKYRWTTKRYITFSGRLLASAILVIGSADVFEAKTQCSGMYYNKTTHH